MDGKHPKRRKDKHNPYSISEKDGHYFLSFKDGQGVLNEFEIDEPLYEMFNTFELDDLSYLNVVDRHIEQSELTDVSLNNRAFQKAAAVEDTVICKLQDESLHKAIAELPETQQRRLRLYYFGELTLEQIAETEGCSFQAVAKSVMAAEKALKKLFQ